MMRLRYRSAPRTHVGLVRSVNEDSLLARDDAALWVVADGMGGHDNGQWASQTLVGQFAGLNLGIEPAARGAAIVTAFEAGNQAINRVAVEAGAGGLCTRPRRRRTEFGDLQPDRQAEGRRPRRRRGFVLQGVQRVAFGSAPGGTVAVDLRAAPAPADKPRALIASVDDRPTSGEDRVVSGPTDGLDLGALPFERKSMRY